MVNEAKNSLGGESEIVKTGSVGETRDAFTPGPWKVMGGRGCYHVASQDEKFETACIMFAGVER